MLEALKKKVSALLPGSPLNVAHQKRNFEQQLRSMGVSRTQAKALASVHFQKVQKS